MWLLPPPGKCPAKGQSCYTCGSGHNQYRALCKQCKKTHHSPCNTRSPRGGRLHQGQHIQVPCNGHHTSQSPNRHSCHCSPSHSQSCSTSCSPSFKVLPIISLTDLIANTPPSSTPRTAVEVIPAAPTDSVKTSLHPKGSLLTERASDGQVSFYTWLQLSTKNSMKLMAVKIDPGAQVNTIPLSRYQKLFPHKINESRYPKPGTLSPTSHTWISHDGTPEPFLGHYTAKVNHMTLPRSYPTRFYVFEDATFSQILFSYTTSERQGILEFKVPNLAAHSHIDTLTVPSSPTPGGWRKTAKCITFCDPSWTWTSHTAPTPPKVAWGRLPPSR